MSRQRKIHPKVVKAQKEDKWADRMLLALGGHLDGNVRYRKVKRLRAELDAHELEYSQPKALRC